MFRDWGGTTECQCPCTDRIGSREVGCKISVSTWVARHNERIRVGSKTKTGILDRQETVLVATTRTVSRSACHGRRQPHNSKYVARRDVWGINDVVDCSNRTTSCVSAPERSGREGKIIIEKHIVSCHTINLQKYLVRHRRTRRRYSERIVSIQTRPVPFKGVICGADNDPPKHTVLNGSCVVSKIGEFS